ncbi:MAG TPA: HEAT repeat domain-containing protein [Anaerolineae bacterium]|nr:HEAT repeat domain-containing protein [Anaerolineae bacterium]HIQ04513.1 HEAT repeat domain-containing protein [Anaerolineae bacterium]
MEEQTEQSNDWQMLIARLRTLPAREQIQEVLRLAGEGFPPAVELFLERLGSTDSAESALLEELVQETVDEAFWLAMLRFCATGLWLGKSVPIAPPASQYNRSLCLEAEGLYLSTGNKPADPVKDAVLLEALVDTEETVVRAIAARFLGERRVVAGREILLQALADEAEVVQMAAVKALGEVQAIEALEPLKALLLRGEEDLCAAAAQALCAIGGPALDALREALQSPSERTRWYAVRALATSGHPEAVEPLLEALQDPNYGIRWQAAEGLVRLRMNGLLSVLEAITEEVPPAWVRAGILHVLQNAPTLAAQEAVRPLVESLSLLTDVALVPVRATEALQKLREAEARTREVEAKVLQSPIVQPWTPAKEELSPPTETPETGKQLTWSLSPYRCYHCGGASPTATPGPEGRCPYCGYHLRHCRNCQHFDGTHCMLHLPYAVHSALPGNRCPSFVFRKLELTG